MQNQFKSILKAPNINDVIDEIIEALEKQIDDTGLIKAFRQKAKAGKREECLKIMN